MRSPIAGAALRGLAIGYPVALLIFMMALRLIGEQWWGTTIALYLPRFPFALPLLPLTAAIVWIGPRRLLWTQLAAFALLLGLTGFQVAWPVPATPGALSLRIVSCNINGGALGLRRIMKPLLARNPDIIVLQEVGSDSYPGLRKLVPGYTVRENGQFWLASRFPVVDTIAPQGHINGLPSMPFTQYRILTPAGPVMLFNVHPISPRDGLQSVRGEGLRQAREVVARNTSFRLGQLQTISDNVHVATDPVIIAGDTNFPAMSWAFARSMGDFTDGFVAAGSGFGFSYPSPRDPWMRIDRVMADPAHWRFRGFEVINQYISDHYAITALLELRPSSQQQTATRMR